MYAGGNMWVAGVDFISFFRHVVKLALPIYDRWQHYEAAAEHAGWRFMHPKFCIVVDFPEYIQIDGARRPHCASGPSHRWRDGWEIFHWHGLLIPESHHWIITHRDRIRPEAIEAEANAELRRVMLEIYGFDRYLAARNAKVVAADELHGQPRRLLETQVVGETIRIVEVVNGSLEPDGTRRKFHLGAMPGKTPHDVIAASYGIAPQHYREAART